MQVALLSVLHYDIEDVVVVEGREVADYILVPDSLENVDFFFGLCLALGGHFFHVDLFHDVELAVDSGADFVNNPVRALADFLEDLKLGKLCADVLLPEVPELPELAATPAEAGAFPVVRGHRATLGACEHRRFFIADLIIRKRSLNGFE